MAANLHPPAALGKRIALGLALLSLGCRSTPRAGSADATLYLGAGVVTLDGAVTGARAILVRAGRIAAIGDTMLLRDPRARDARLVRLPGATFAPPLVDHHVHLFNVGLVLLNDRERGRLFLDLSGAKGLDDVFRLVRARATTVPPGAWIVGTGWNQLAWGMTGLPTRDTLDAAAPGHPVYLGRSDGHAGWANARALAAAHIDAGTPDPAGGTIGRRADGSPNGVLLERANELLQPLLPALADHEIIEAWRLGAAALAERGVTRVYDAGVLPLPGVVGLQAPHGHFLDLLRRADAESPLPLTVHVMVPAPSALADSLLATGRGIRELSPRIRVTHLKLFGDGALGSRGAALTHPYADDAATRGVPRMAAAEIATLVTRALDAGLGVATHAIGDEAVSRALDAYEQVLAARPGTDPLRLRIEHFSYAREADFARAQRLGVVLSIQGNFNSGTADDPPFGAVRVGAANEPRVYAWRRLVTLGVPIAEGSDYFTRPVPALSGFVAALTRRHAATEGLPARDARLAAYRLASTWRDASGHAMDPALRVGGEATFIALSVDPLTAPLEAVAQGTVRGVIVRGERRRD